MTITDNKLKAQSERAASAGLGGERAIGGHRTEVSA